MIEAKALRGGDVVGVGLLLAGGFRIVRERGGALLIWTAILLVATIAADFGTAAALQDNMEAVFAGAEPVDAQMSFLLWSILIGCGWLVVSSILYAATMRLVLRPREGGPGCLRLGMDEVRLFVLSCLFLVVLVTGFLLATVVLGLHFVGAGEDALGVMQLVLLLLGLTAFLYFGTRLSLVFALTLKQGAFSVDDGWRLTKGHFWTLFATFLIISVLLFAAGLLIVLATEPGYLSAVSQQGFSSPEADEASMRHLQMLMAGEIDAQTVARWVLNSIQGAIGYALAGGAAATAVQQLTTDEEGLRETFA